MDEKLFIRFQETENGGFRKRIGVDRASDPLKRYFRLSGVPWLRYNILICSVILGELESIRNYWGIFVHLPKTLGLLSENLR